MCTYIHRERILLQESIAVKLDTSEEATGQIQRCPPVRSCPPRSQTPPARVRAQSGEGPCVCPSHGATVDDANPA